MGLMQINDKDDACVILCACEVVPQGPP